MLTITEKKEELLKLIAENHQLAKNVSQPIILAAIEKLEASNPNPKPLEMQKLLKGNWQLLHTTSKSLLNNLNRIPGFKRGKIYQVIENNRIYNIAELEGLLQLDGLICAVAQFKPVSEERIDVYFEKAIIGLQSFIPYNSPQQFVKFLEEGKRPLAFNLAFPSIFAKFTSWFVIRKLSYLLVSNNPVGWLKTTYIDDNLRIVKGNFEGTYVLTKI